MFILSVPLWNQRNDDDWDWDEPSNGDRELGMSSAVFHEEHIADKEDDDLQMALALSMQEQTKGKFI